MLVTQMDGVACRDFVSNMLILKNRRGVIGHRILPKWQPQPAASAVISTKVCLTKNRQLHMRFFLSIGLLLCIPTVLAAQTSTGTLRGRITDPSGAVIPRATVMANTAEGRSVTVMTNNQGVYEFKGLPIGSYTVTAVAKGFATDEEDNVNIAAGQAQQLDIALQIQV